jgi:hypothetical protein
MDFEYHWQRYQQEKERAQRSAHAVAATAHHELAVLHLRRIKDGDENCSGNTVSRQ